MVKSYLRYEPAATFGVIASVDSNIEYDSSGKHLLAPALEKIGVWHVRQGVCTKTLTPSTSSIGPSLAVTSVASSSSSLVRVFFLSFSSTYMNVRMYRSLIRPAYALRGRETERLQLWFETVQASQSKQMNSRFLLAWAVG